jgi:hypothetical protein
LALWQKVAAGVAGQTLPDAHNYIGRALGRKCSEILYERNLGVFVGGTGIYKRMFSYVERPWRLLAQFQPNGSGIFPPGLEIPAKRMKQHDLLGLSRDSSRTTERRR